jgi:hypothetical protein
MEGIENMEKLEKGRQKPYSQKPSNKWKRLILVKHHDGIE